jgi:DNA polymerase-1
MTTQKSLFNKKVISTTEPSLFILDGNSYLHRAYHGYKNKPLTNHRGEYVTVVYGFLQTLGADLAKLNPTHVCLCFDGQGKNWRHHDFPEYKANRTDVACVAYTDSNDANTDQQNAWVRKLMSELGFCVVYKRGVEGDDAVCSAVTAALPHKNVKVVLGARDKDLCSLISDQVSMWDAIGGVMLDSKAVVAKHGVRPDQMSEYLGLMGDKIDNIPGCPGLGNVTAKKILSEFGTVKSFMQTLKRERDTCTNKLWVRMYDKILDNRDGVKLSLELTKLRNTMDLDFDQFTIDKPSKKVKPLLQEIGINKLHPWFSSHLIKIQN